ncbi:MAG TPA: vWA domain-containing protein [Pyrinomonadaceae bacterium]|nr:vWA domain-containing protein [Pyrinomonadaceae bacterium]
MKDATHIAVVLDRSGSMGDIKDETINGFNCFLAEQKAAGDNATLTLVQFDTESTDVVHESKPIREVPDLNHETFQPRGGTPLLDALGQTIDSTGRALAAIPEANRPNKVVFVVITDGQENSSRHHTKAGIKEKIDHQSGKYNWQFVYLGANQDAFDEAGAVGITMARAANYAPQRMAVAFAATAANVASYRRSGDAAKLAYSDDQRAEMLKESDDTNQ